MTIMIRYRGYIHLLRWYQFAALDINLPGAAAPVYPAGRPWLF